MNKFLLCLSTLISGCATTFGTSSATLEKARTDCKPYGGVLEYWVTHHADVVSYCKDGKKMIVPFIPFPKQ